MAAINGLMFGINSGMICMFALDEIIVQDASHALNAEAAGYVNERMLAFLKGCR
jgi:hypothetical protein